MVSKKLFLLLFCILPFVSCDDKLSQDNESDAFSSAYTQNTEKHRKHKIETWRRKPRKRVYLSGINPSLFKEYQYTNTDNNYLVKK